MDTAGIEVSALPGVGFNLPERHLGLIQAVEHPDLEKAIADYAVFVADHVDRPVCRLWLKPQITIWQSALVLPPQASISLCPR